MEDVMRSQDMTADEIVRRGQEIYHQKLEPVLDPGEHGRYAVISVENGDFAIADTTTEAGSIMRSRYPDQVFYEVRVGYDIVTKWSSPQVLDVARKA